MKADLSSGKSSGFSLAELAVASFLLALLLTLTLLAMQGGVRQYKALRSEVDMQQDAMVILARLAREVGESHAGGTWPEPTPLTPLFPTEETNDPKGIVFLSPRDSNGKMWLDETGQTIWQKRVCIYHDPVTKRLYRCVEPLATPTTTPPPPEPSKDVSYFSENVAKDPLPGQVEDFAIEVGESVRNFRVDLVVSNQVGPKKTILEFVTSTTAKG